MKMSSDTCLTRIAVKVKRDTKEILSLCYKYNDRLGARQYKNAVYNRRSDFDELDVSRTKIGKIAVKVYSGDNIYEQAYFGIQIFDRKGN